MGTENMTEDDPQDKGGEASARERLRVFPRNSAFIGLALIVISMAVIIPTLSRSPTAGARDVIVVTLEGEYEDLRVTYALNLFGHAYTSGNSVSLHFAIDAMSPVAFDVRVYGPNAGSLKACKALRASATRTETSPLNSSPRVAGKNFGWSGTLNTGGQKDEWAGVSCYLEGHYGYTESLGTRSAYMPRILIRGKYEPSCVASSTVLEVGALGESSHTLTTCFPILSGEFSEQTEGVHEVLPEKMFWRVPSEEVLREQLFLWGGVLIGLTFTFLTPTLIWLQEKYLGG